MAGATVRKHQAAIRREVVEPIAEAIEKATSLADLKRRLGSGLLRRMGTEAVETALGEASVQAALIGRTAAAPVEKKKGLREQGTREQGRREQGNKGTRKERP